MPNNSATGGPLVPSASPAPLEDDALLDFFHGWIAGMTGIDVKFIRPRWQQEPPNIPENSVNWLAFGITKREADTFGAELHVSAGQGYNETRRHEALNLLASFYGPNASSLAAMLRDGMQVAQNREVLGLNNMGLVESGDITPVPELLKERWLYRVDLPFTIRRQIVRNYAVQNLLSGHVTLDNELFVETINI